VDRKGKEEEEEENVETGRGRGGARSATVEGRKRGERKGGR